MKKLILIHGWGGSPTGEGWFGWLREECEKRNIKLIAPQMPNTDNPVISEWIQKLSEVAKDLDKETYFVGHSMGCQTIIRYLSKLDEKIVVGGAIFIAPWTKLDKKSIEEEGEESVSIIKSWIDVPMNFEEAKKHLRKCLAIFSDDDPYIPLSEMDIFKEKLCGEVILKNKEEHFNETKEINEIMEFIDDDNTNSK